MEMEQDLDNIIVAGANPSDIEAAIIINILGDHEQQMDGNDEIHEPFNLDDVLMSDCKYLFRFEKNDIYRLCAALRMPPYVRTYKGNKVTGLTCLCMVLRRLAYPNRLRDLNLFGLSPQSMSLIINRGLEIIMNNHSHLIENLQGLQWLNHQRLQLYAEAIQNKGGAIPNCWGFIDGTARAICKPSVDEENYYSGHKRFHCIKYKSVLCPDGIIASLKGAWAGRRHDAAMLAESGLYEELERVAVFPEQNFVLYGDQAYGLRELLLTPFPNRGNLEPHQLEFNNSMKLLRLTVEWGFQKVISEFAFLDFKKNQKLLLQDVELMYKVGIILCNCHSTLYGNQTSQYFNVNPPILEEYLG
ncbi:hypothetical protein NQ315_014603 [Exocentrus adspersus]|uniref:DDE Tnp4 domain-containing protein n=1 Tax=Exocentrus adspersus TaxID=1586481 RepID=A0AAV8VQ45_9CUCU|nr:hypothetical protein NQ315_014603 [Exocentrus adspersus]